LLITGGIANLGFNVIDGISDTGHWQAKHVDSQLQVIVQKLRA
jgi:hypothetical protein